ncbi:UdgX family uracil-DNA binding protein [Dyella sp. BiH032]|uniref:UdgX family uracil-DNA binding protein n=1 Tax=Dyella sp. BiH032 TaxID=3075430 RepID=UPI002892B268|nr:UdgX family uracil-DNA binding protein [Dyella sp. BiH032]WNL44123.1 UdgX family uracil-DNA binding protein [Dyella sp. BiH032]
MPAWKETQLDAPEIHLAKPPERLPAGTLASVRRQALVCHDCPLWMHATQTVFGKGPAHAQVMLVGEQPGAQEDLQGEPFVGPAGRILDKALEEAGLQRKDLYLTNTVKHFKFEPRGKARLHKRASASEQAACRQWLAAELLRVKPRVVVALGAMAAQTLFGAQFRMTRQRGQWLPLSATAQGLSTWHPSYVLRVRDEASRERAYAELVADLRLVAAQLAAT